MDQRLLAAPHGFSQRATSFIASWCQGIHRTPLSCSSSRDHGSEEPDPTLHRNHPTADRSSEDNPSQMPPFACRLRETTNKPGRTHNAHPVSHLRFCANRIAGTWFLNLIRSDMQFVRADAPNPDSRFKEHALDRTRRRDPHTARLIRLPPNALCP
jgi:hypothetical protein